MVNLKCQKITGSVINSVIEHIYGGRGRLQIHTTFVAWKGLNVDPAVLHWHSINWYSITWVNQHLKNAFFCFYISLVTYELCLWAVTNGHPNMSIDRRTVFVGTIIRNRYTIQNAGFKSILAIRTVATKGFILGPAVPNCKRKSLCGIPEVIQHVYSNITVRKLYLSIF